MTVPTTSLFSVIFLSGAKIKSSGTRTGDGVILGVALESNDLLGVVLGVDVIVIVTLDVAEGEGVTVVELVAVGVEEEDGVGDSEMEDVGVCEGVEVAVEDDVNDGAGEGNS